MAEGNGRLQIQQIRSPIGFPRKQRATLKSLGLCRMHHVVEQKDNPAIRGMIAKIPHLIRVLEAEGSEVEK